MISRDTSKNNSDGAGDGRGSDLLACQCGDCEPGELVHKLIDRGEYCRASLIGTLLITLNDDLAPDQVTWLLALVRELQLSDEEIVEWQDLLLELVSSPHFLVSILASNMIERPNGIRPIKAPALIDMFTRTLEASRRGKTSVLTGLNLISAAMKAEPKMASELVICAAKAFTIGAIDVQEKVFEILKDRFNPLSLDEIKELVATYDSSLNPAMKTRLKNWYRYK